MGTLETEPTNTNNKGGIMSLEEKTKELKRIVYRLVDDDIIRKRIETRRILQEDVPKALFYIGTILAICFIIGYFK
jgi:hypothetical protein